MGTQPALLKRGWSPPPQFSAHVYCGQTAGWIKLGLGKEVGLGLRHIVLDGDPAPLPKKGAEPLPIFGPFLLWPNGWMHQDATWYGGRSQPRQLCVKWGHIPLPKKGGAPKIFCPRLLCPNGCMDQNAAWHGGRRHCVRWGPSSPCPKGAQPPIFGHCPLWPNGWMD